MKEKSGRRLILGLHRLLFILAVLTINLSAFQSFGQSIAWVAPKSADNVKNPLSGNVSKVADTKALYITNCGPCHGDKGKGDGPAAQGLNPKPADHTSAAVQSESDGAIFWKLSEGRNPMPGYKKIFSEEQRWELINYIRTLAKGVKKK
ncbi:MAG TPA: c-type cytochrome [Puia sp.]|jgi:mono/diheme cytochrome c family protein